MSSATGALTAEEVSKKYTVAELRKILKENGLSTSGKKKDLVERVLPVLNEDSSEASVEDKKEDAEQAKDSAPVEVVDLSSLVGDEFLNSALGIFGINYGDLPIKDKVVAGDDNNLNIEGFTKDGLSMSDFTMSIKAASDSSNVDLKMNIPEVSYSDFESNVFTFKNLDLSILPSSNPQSLAFSATLDSLDVLTGDNYVNLKGLDLFFKAFPDENAICLDMNIDNFILPDFDDSLIKFENIKLIISGGLNGQDLGMSVSLPSLELINKNYKVKVSDLNLDVTVPDSKVSNLNLSILMSDFNYTNFEDVVINMNNMNVSLETILNSNNFNVIIGMNSFDATGLNSFDDMFPMITITSVSFKNPATSSEFPINLTGLISPLDISRVSLTELVYLLTSGFNLDTYLGNMANYKGYFGADAEGIYGTAASDNFGFDLGKIFENFDFSSLSGIVLNLSGLIDYAGIDLANLGIDASDYDLSAISVPEIMAILDDSGFNMDALSAMFKLFTIDFDKVDTSRLIVGFDVDNFDISGLLASLNLSDLDISAILEIFTNPDFDLEGIFKNFDFSCLDGIVLDLSGLIDSLGIDLAVFGIDVSGYDLSAITISDIMAILNDSKFDMTAFASMFELFNIDFNEVDMSGLVKSFDVDNFDMSGLLASLNLSDKDISAILEMFNNPEFDFASIFENCDYSCLDGVVLDLSGLIDSLGIDVNDLGVDLSEYDLSAITLSDLIAIFNNPDFDMSKLDLSDLDLNKVDMSGLVKSFDEDTFDVSGLLSTFDLSGEDISGITEMFDNLGLDFASIFENCDYSCLNAIVLDLSGLIDSLGIDLAVFGIDVSDYDLSAIGLSDLIGILNDSGFSMDAILSMFKLSDLELENLDLSGLVKSFDSDNFDISAILNGLDLPIEDISAIFEMFTNSDIDWEEVFKNFDYSCLNAIVLDLSGLIDSLGIDLANFGIDVSGYDLSAISLSDIIDILNDSGFSMDVILAMFKLSDLELENLDFSGLVKSFDFDNFDMSFILNGLDLPIGDISAIFEMFNNPDIDWEGIFKNFDYSCLNAIVLDLSGLINSTGIDLADFGIDVSGYDLSAIGLSDLIDIINDSNFSMDAIAEMCKLFTMDFDNLNLSELIVSFDLDNLDIDGLMQGLDSAGVDISRILDLCEMYGFDLNEFLNQFLTSFTANAIPEDTGVSDKA